MDARFSHVMLYTADLDAAIAWYRDTLGFTLSYRAGAHYASLRHPTMGQLDLHPLKEGEAMAPQHSAQPSYTVADLDAAVAELTAQGVKVNPIQEVGDGHRHTWFWDPDGNVIGLG